MDNIILEGLSISLTAMLLTFLSLGLFILVMVVLKRLFPSKPESTGADVEVVSRALAENTDPCGPTEEEGAVVAAIAATVSYMRAQAQAGLGDNLKQGRGGWWNASYQRKPQKR